MNRKPIIAIDMSSTGKGGGPFVSTNRILNSGLKYKYNFKIINYQTEIGRGISFKRIRNLVNQLKEIKPDIVHFSGLQLSGFHMAVASKLAGIKNTIITVRGFSGDAIYFHPVKKFLLTFFVEPFTLLLTKKIYGNSEYTVNRKLIRIFNFKCFGAIYNFPPQSANNDSEIRKELGFDTSDIIIITVARIIRDKGYHIFDEAITKFKNFKDLKFLIVGTGDYLTEMKLKLKYQVENRQVFFLGHRDDVQTILKGCDIFVLPTLHETLSIALLEASVEGLALIASNTGGVPEIVENNYNGYLVEPGNIDDLVNAMKELYSNSEKRRKFSSNAKKKVNEKFSIEGIENKIDQVYQSLLKL